MNLREHSDWLCLGSVNEPLVSGDCWLKHHCQCGRCWKSLSLISTDLYGLSVTWMRSFMTHWSLLLIMRSRMDLRNTLNDWRKIQKYLEHWVKSNKEDFKKNKYKVICLGLSHTHTHTCTHIDTPALGVLVFQSGEHWVPKCSVQAWGVGGVEAVWHCFGDAEPKAGQAIQQSNIQRG